ncbi:MAG: DUF1971 domain-containing protein [Parvibaculaceae bacterium]|nr:DUF1971 domain-containing protein [Parvibaculaceae bacterium]
MTQTDTSNPISVGTASLPKNSACYKQTAIFDETTVPEALKNDHCTKLGVWGVLHLVEGKLHYQLRDSDFEIILKTGDKMLIEPKQYHKVRLEGPVRFFVEFYKEDGE